SALLQPSRHWWRWSRERATAGSRGSRRGARASGKDVIGNALASLYCRTDNIAVVAMRARSATCQERHSKRAAMAAGLLRASAALVPHATGRAAPGARTGATRGVGGSLHSLLRRIDPGTQHDGRRKRCQEKVKSDREPALLAHQGEPRM